MEMDIFPIYSHIEQDPSDNNHHSCGCCGSADACHTIDNVGADEENEERDG